MKKENPLPEGKSNDELAEEHADYFLNKIETIRNDLKDIRSHQPYSDRIIPLFDRWQDLSQDELNKTKLITTMATKSCEMDIMPTVPEANFSLSFGSNHKNYKLFPGALCLCLILEVRYSSPLAQEIRIGSNFQKPQTNQQSCFSFQGSVKSGTSTV